MIKGLLVVQLQYINDKSLCSLHLGIKLKEPHWWHNDA